MRARRTLLVAAIAVIALAVGAGSLLTRRHTSQPTLPSSADARVRQALFEEIQPVEVTNCDLERFGEAHDGGYLLCANLLGAAKAGYSYGISGYDGWGCELSKRFEIAVHEYDCFDLRAPDCAGGKTVFHGECVGTRKEQQDGRPFDSIAGQFATNGDDARSVIMKMDVEGAEWDAFLLSPDSVFQHIDQLVVEFHHVEDPKFVATIQRLKRFFDIAHVHYNNFSCDPKMQPFPSWAFEVLFVSKRIAHSNDVPASATSTLDAPNNPNAPDCQAPAQSSGIL